ncbi:hypothetical protein L6164_031857 [Bauhinia variegata]|uniref:Uncharacterized protein n=1 Tax=Bauhinia variegata TaxID=167791 RepID=A0ACB9KLT9_BAUVA|nr:hypothetical protein L6164_031857 [Bauhinia variegata]
MSLSLDLDKGKVGQKEYTHSCYYCNKVFNDYHALGGHLRAHQEEIKIRRNQNYAGPSRNPIDGTTSNPILSMNSLDKTSSTFLIKDPSLSKGIYSENSINGDPNIQLTLSPNYSYARNKMKASSTSCVRRTLPSTLPMDSPSYMVPMMNGFNQGIDSNKFRSSPYDHSTNLACKRAGEQWLRVQGDEITASSSKRSKINFIPPVFHETKMPKKKGSLLVKDANLGKDKSAACDNADDHARENCEAKLDLSLHL